MLITFELLFLILLIFKNNIRSIILWHILKYTVSRFCSDGKCFIIYDCGMIFVSVFSYKSKLSNKLFFKHFYFTSFSFKNKYLIHTKFIVMLLYERRYLRSNGLWINKFSINRLRNFWGPVGNSFSFWISGSFSKNKERLKFY